MKCPQTTALALEKNIGQIGKNGCLAMCYIYCAGIDENDEMEYIRICDRAIKDGILSEDCAVKDADRFLEWLTGRNVKVLKKNIESIDGITEATPVRFVAEGYGGHWVVAGNGKIVFNPLLNSVNVNRGKPRESRPIKWGIR